MTVYIHEATGERVQPKPGGPEEDRIKDTKGWRPESDKERADREGKRVANAHGTARVNIAGGES